MYRISVLSRVAGVVVGLTWAVSAYAVSGCTNNLLNGNFGMQLSGSSTPAMAGESIAGVAVPGGTTGSAPATVAGVAWLHLDGGGNLSGYSAANIAGAWLQGNLTGTYSVNSDCSATFTVADSSGAAETFRGVLVNQGSVVFVAQTDAGANVSGSIRPMRGSCAPADLAGTFGIQYSGAAGGTAFSSTGMVALDGQGNATATENRLLGGKSSVVASSGAITVNTDCSASIQLASADGTTVNLAGMISADEKQIFFVRSDAGTAVTGIIVAQ